MLDKITVSFLSKVYGKTEQEVRAAESNPAEMSLGAPVGEFYTKEENDTRAENVRKAGIEIGMKQAFTKAGIDFVDADKNPDRLVEIFKTHFSTDADKKLQKELKTAKDELQSLKDKGGDPAKLAELQQKYDTLKSTYDEELPAAKKELETYKANVLAQEKDNFILGTLPEKAILSKSDMLLIGRNKLDLFKGDDGKWYAKEGENIVADKLGNPEPAENIYKRLWEDNYTKSSKTPGPGDHNYQKRTKAMSADEARTYIEKNTNHTISSPEGLKLFSELQQAPKVDA